MDRFNKVLIKEWVNKAEGDFAAALALNKSKRKNKFYFVIAFHCQQTIEKYLKALLISRKIDFPKSHDLIQLLNLLKIKDPLLEGIKKELNILNPFAIDFRYPGEDIEPKEAKEVLKVAKRLVIILKKRLKEFI